MKSQTDQKSQLPLLLCLHGFTGDPYDFEPMMEQIESQVAWRFVALPWHCPLFSPLPLGDPWKRFINHIDAIATEAIHDQRPLIVLAYSMGARLWLAAWKEKRWPVERSLLIGCSPGITEEQERFLRWSADAQLATKLRIEGMDAFLEHWQNQPLIQPQTLSPHWPIRLARKRTLHPDYLARALLECSPGGMDPLWDLLPEWNHATELIAGDSDTKFIALHTRMAQSMPQATCHTFPDTGHSPHLEAPEAFSSWLQDLLF